MPPSPQAPFVGVEVRDRFFQSSAFFPMPIVLLSTVAPDGAPNLAPYSLCFPQLLDDGHAMVLVTRGLSKTAANIERTGRAAIAFVPDDPPLLAGLRALARPLDTAEKMADSVFTLTPDPGGDADAAPLVAEAVQVFACTWDRSLAPETASGERRYLLRVDRIWMQPRWRDALEAGRGWPRLPVDYGFRRASASWISRPRVAMSGPRLRPRFEVVVSRPPAEVAAAFAAVLARPDCAVVGGMSGPHGQLGLPDAERSFWSPHLDLRVEEHAEGSLVRARVGPHPHVWTMFMALHLAVGFTGLGALMWGLSQWLAKEPATALWGVPIALFLNAFIAGAAFIGQALGADQTYRLRSFLDETLEA